MSACIEIKVLGTMRNNYIHAYIYNAYLIHSNIILERNMTSKTCVAGGYTYNLSSIVSCELERPVMEAIII